MLENGSFNVRTALVLVLVVVVVAVVVILLWPFVLKESSTGVCKIAHVVDGTCPCANSMASEVEICCVTTNSKWMIVIKISKTNSSD